LGQRARRETIDATVAHDERLARRSLSFDRVPGIDIGSTVSRLDRWHEGGWMEISSGAGVTPIRFGASGGETWVAAATVGRRENSRCQANTTRIDAVHRPDQWN
jgi:hypothetical protein